jgi:hypothetical protein
MRVYLVNEGNPVAKTLVAKLENVKHGQIIPVTAEEMRFVKGNNLMVLDIPEDITSVIEKTIAAMQGGNKEPAAKKAEAPIPDKKPTVDQKPLGTPPKSPVA